MSDTALLSGAFSMLDQPIIVSRREKIIFMNSEAIDLAGANHTGKPLDMLIRRFLMPLVFSLNASHNANAEEAVSIGRIRLRISPAIVPDKTESKGVITAELLKLPIRSIIPEATGTILSMISEKETTA